MAEMHNSDEHLSLTVHRLTHRADALDMFNYEFEAISETIAKALFGSENGIPRFSLFEFPNTDEEYDFVYGAFATAVSTNAQGNWNPRYKTVSKLVPSANVHVAQHIVYKSGWYSPPTEFDFHLENVLVDYWSITYIGEEDADV